MTNFLNLPDQLAQIIQNLGIFLPELLLSTSFLGIILIDLVLHQDLRKKHQIVKDASQANHFLMILSIIISIAIMMIFAGPVSKFVNQHPTIQILGLSFLILIGVMLVAEGSHLAHFRFGNDSEVGTIPKGY